MLCGASPRRRRMQRSRRRQEFRLGDRHCEQSEAIRTKPQFETPSLGRFALLAMTESAAPSLPPSILGFDFDGAGRAGGAQQEARDVVAEADYRLLHRLARAGK